MIQQLLPALYMRQVLKRDRVPDADANLLPHFIIDFMHQETQSKSGNSSLFNSNSMLLAFPFSLRINPLLSKVFNMLFTLAGSDSKYLCISKWAGATLCSFL